MAINLSMARALSLSLREKKREKKVAVSSSSSCLSAWRFETRVVPLLCPCRPSFRSIKRHEKFRGRLFSSSGQSVGNSLSQALSSASTMRTFKSHSADKSSHNHKVRSLSFSHLLSLAHDCLQVLAIHSHKLLFHKIILLHWREVCFDPFFFCLLPPCGP